jgi:hypothetical protein
MQRQSELLRPKNLVTTFPMMISNSAKTTQTQQRPPFQCLSLFIEKSQIERACLQIV